MKSSYFTKSEIALWVSSLVFIIASFFLFDRVNYLALTASLIGASALILCAKGNPIGQLLMVFFSLIYAYISYTSAYYGEMITYLGMSGPMALISFISWITHPYKGNKAEVKINRIKLPETLFMLALSVIVTYVFYFILKYLGTANLATSTVSIITSFAAMYLTFRRSPYYALAYALNDIVLIVLWSMASSLNTSYLSVIICFVMFLANDIYGFINWLRMEKKQKGNA